MKPTQKKVFKKRLAEALHYSQNELREIREHENKMRVFGVYKTPPKTGAIAKKVGVKFDQGKLRWSLLPWKALRKVVEVLEFGATKYAPGNWMKVENGAERYKEATLRHIEARLEGETVDPESGLPTLAHGACSLLFWLWFEVTEKK